MFNEKFRKFWLILGVVFLATAFFVVSWDSQTQKNKIVEMQREIDGLNKAKEVDYFQKNGLVAPISVSRFYDDCSAEQDNVAMTECAIKTLDQVAAEREWKQRKIETLKYPQIDEPNFDRILDEAQLKIKTWRDNFEKNRDLWCEARLSFAINGSGMPSAWANCQMEVELEAIKVLNNIYYENIMKDVGTSKGISDFEPTKFDVDALTKTNKTKRGCVWAGEDKNCD